MIHHIAVILAGLQVIGMDSIGFCRGRSGPWEAGKCDELETMSGGLIEVSFTRSEGYLYVEEVLGICASFYVFFATVSFPFRWCHSSCRIKFNMLPYTS